MASLNCIIAGSSRARCAGAELGDQPYRIDAASLASGVCIGLAHGIVLFLHPGSATEATDTCPLPGLLGASHAMCDLRRQLLRVARSEVDVLIRGETGTGKEVVARALHEASARAGQPWVVVNMAAIPPGLAPAALFGASRGAFTGAERATEGYFQAARHR